MRKFAADLLFIKMLARIKTRKYTISDKKVWDKFVISSKNGTFLFLRDYMDYHSDRFVDHSLLFFDEKNKLLALLPANIENGILYTHKGLTYGGFVLGHKTCISDMTQLMTCLISYCRENEIKSVIYKVVPTIYHVMPSQEDEYALWQAGAEIMECNISSTIDLHNDQCKPTSKRGGVYRSFLKKGYSVEWGASLDEYWPILEAHLLEKFEAKPVHSLSEIKKLQTTFPDNIRCILVRNAEGTVEGGVVVYINTPVVHLQYSAMTSDGAKNNSLTFLLYAIYEWCKEQSEYRYFDLGTSNEDDGHILNSGLEFWKYTFGGRGVAYKYYRLNLDREL